MLFLGIIFFTQVLQPFYRHEQMHIRRLYHVDASDKYSPDDDLVNLEILDEVRYDEMMDSFSVQIVILLIVITFKLLL